ncbi:SMP-30/gluconolactonase/LRE family protein [Streptomyces sp. NPDC000345]|uniref:SMP-30/gluconolactonase/LRE family protein n=1 Tax=Streptomyces sp. NPDC000345 TaxID=3364537 RepID=UPI0036C7CF3E
MSTPTRLYSGFRFPEGGRWHDGRLWFSDMHTGEIFRVDPDGDQLPEVVTRIDDQPSGLGWLADGSLLISSMLRRVVLKHAPDGSQSVHADLSAMTDAPINDMVVDESGTAYLGGFGYDLYAGAPQENGPVFAIPPTGEARVADSDMVFPNGAVILPGTRTLVVAETWAARLTAFDIGEDGELSGKRLWAPLPAGSTPDGLCVDAEGGVWVSCIVNGRFIRVLAGGEVTDVVDVPGRCATDCVLGGHDGRSLYLLTSNSWQPADTEERQGWIETVRVDVPGPQQPSYP